MQKELTQFPGHNYRMSAVAAAVGSVQLRKLDSLNEMRRQIGQCPVAERVWFEQQVNLPIYPALRPDQVEHMTEAVARAVRKVRG